MTNSDNRNLIIETVSAYLRNKRIFRALYNIGLLSASAQGSIPDHLNEISESLFKAIVIAMDMRQDKNRCDVFKDALTSFEKENAFIDTDIINHELFCNHYTYISRNHTESDGSVCIDAWRTNKNTEEGTVIAKVKPNTAQVVYIDPKASYDINAQKYITDVQKSIGRV